MQLVEDNAAQVGEQVARVGRREQQRELLGRGQQDVGRVARCRLRLAADVSPVRVSMRRPSRMSATGRLEVALDVDGERLQRRDVERVQRAAVGPAAQVDEGGQEAGERLAGTGRVR